MDLFESLRLLPPVSEKAAVEYAVKQDELRKLVDSVLGAMPEIRVLTGHKELQGMFDNHYYHASFMCVVLRTNNFDLMARIVIWAYRDYSAKGYQSDYFRHEITAWLEAVKLVLSTESAAEIIPVYEWIAAHHEQWIQLSAQPDDSECSALATDHVRHLLLIHLLHGEYNACISCIESYLDVPHDLASLYLDVLQPCLYEIGHMWELGIIQVAQERLVTSLISRLMTAAKNKFQSFHSTGKAIIVCPPQEFHEIGARMVSDLLTLDDWSVDYFGSSASIEGLIRYCYPCPPDFLGISATMSFVLADVEKMITHIRKENRLAKMKIMVGGPAFHHSEATWKNVGADAFAADAREALRIAAEWR